MRGKRSKFPKSFVPLIITVAVVILFLAAVLITNIFIPVRYFSAFTVSAEKNEEGTLRVTFIDVDFGDCVLIELPDGKIILSDCGDGAYSNVKKVLSVLNERGVNRIDYLICTSVKDEHCGGFAEVLKYKKVDKAFIPYVTNTRITDEFHSAYRALTAAGAEIVYASVGEGIFNYESGYFLAFLSPANYKSPASEYHEMNADYQNPNIENASVVSWLQYQNFSFALTSDVRPTALKRIIDEYKLCETLNQPFQTAIGYEINLKNCTVMTVPAHGGEDNTYAPWYDLTAPQYAVISVGKNFGGYPSKIALADISAYCQPYYTSHNGDLTFTVKSGEITVEGSRQSD